jgi:hypothetical protein
MVKPLSWIGILSAMVGLAALASCGKAVLEGSNTPQQSGSLCPNGQQENTLSVTQSSSPADQFFLGTDVTSVLGVMVDQQNVNFLFDPSSQILSIDPAATGVSGSVVQIEDCLINATVEPSPSPTVGPSGNPVPSGTPTGSPTGGPTGTPTGTPTGQPTGGYPPKPPCKPSGKPPGKPEPQPSWISVPNPSSEKANF